MSTQAGYESRSHSGWITYASILMFSVGFFRILSGISYLADSHKINNFTLGFFGDNMWAWGIWDLVIAALALYAGYSLLGGGTYGRVVTYIWGVLVIVNSFLVIAYAPWYAVTMITVAALAIWGLAVSSEER
jgi:hypothetical protein